MISYELLINGEGVISYNLKKDCSFLVHYQLQDIQPGEVFTVLLETN